MNWNTGRTASRGTKLPCEKRNQNWPLENSVLHDAVYGVPRESYTSAQSRRSSIARVCDKARNRLRDERNLTPGSLSSRKDQLAEQKEGMEETFMCSFPAGKTSTGKKKSLLKKLGKSAWEHNRPIPPLPILRRIQKAQRRRRTLDRSRVESLRSQALKSPVPPGFHST